MSLAGGASVLLRGTAQDLQAQGDVIDPTPRVDTEVSAEQRRIKNSEGFLVWITVSCEDLRKKKKRKEIKTETKGGSSGKEYM